MIETSAIFATFLKLLLNLPSPKSHSDGQPIAQKSNLNLYKYLGVFEVWADNRGKIGNIAIRAVEICTKRL